MFHEPCHQRNRSRNQDPAVDYFYSAAEHRSRGALWSSFAPARILGLRTRPLSQSGNGLVFDKATVALIQQLAAVYVVEDMLEGADNLHGPQTSENK